MASGHRPPRVRGRFNAIGNNARTPRANAFGRAQWTSIIKSTMVNDESAD